MINKIKVCRAGANISQAKLAELCGVSRQTIIAIEQAKYVPSTLLSLKISSIFNLNVNDIFQLEETDWK